MINTISTSWFKGIKGRLLVSALLPVIGLVLLGTTAYNGIHRVVELLEVANQQVIPTLDVLSEMRQDRYKFSFEVLHAMNSVQDLPTLNARLKEARHAFENFKKAQETYDPIPRTKEEDVLYSEVRPHIEGYYKNMNEVLSLVESADPQKITMALALMENELAKVDTKVGKWIDGTQKIYSDEAKKGVTEALQTKASVNNMIIFGTLGSALVIFGFMMMSASRISNTVASISSRLTQAGGQVSSSVEQLNEAGDSLSEASTEAAASLEETVASIEELASMVRMNADNAKQAAALSHTSKDAAERGENEIKLLIESMSSISNSSKKIEEIISVIDDIAFQTNLLALNAAVEAARAGEQGKGFAVVADAVRTLAQKSAIAAKDIAQLIQDSTQHVEKGARFAQQSGVALGTITTSVKKVSDLNSEIAAASSEQSTGLEQISKAMNQLDQAAQSNAASSEEIAASSREIGDLAETTKKLTHELNEMIEGPRKVS